MKQNAKKVLTGLFPLTAGALVLLQYYLVPNYRSNTITNVYPTMIAVLMLAIVLLMVGACFHAGCRDYLREHVAWYTAIFLIFLIADRLTLKTGRFGLPMFPWPDRLLNEIIIDKSVLLDCAKNSLKLLFTGYFWGMLFGLLTGVLGGRSAKARYWIEPVLRVLGPIPAVTWMALFFVLSPSLFVGCVIMVAYSVWYPVASGIMSGILSVNRSYGEVAKTLGAANELQMVLHVTIPLIMPNLFQGLISGMRSACASLMIAEMMGVESGLAWYITWQRGWGNFTKMYTAVVAICLTFLMVDTVLSILKRRVLRWQEVTK